MKYGTVLEMYVVSIIFYVFQWIALIQKISQMSTFSQKMAFLIFIKLKLYSNSSFQHCILT